MQLYGCAAWQNVLEFALDASTRCDLPVLRHWRRTFEVICQTQNLAFDKPPEEMVQEDWIALLAGAP